MIQKTFYSLLFTALFLSFGYGQNGNTEILDKVVATIGGEFILLSDVEGQYAYVAQSGNQVTEDAKCQILEGIIGQKLMVHQSRLDSLQVTAAEVDAQLDFRFDQVLQQMKGDEAFFQEYYGATVEQMKARMRDDQREQILAERMQRTLIQRVAITPEEVKEFYDNIPKDSLPFLNAEVELGEIVLKPKVNPTEYQNALDKISKIREQLEAGEDFGELAKKYSDDPGSAANGGDLGFAKRGIFAPEFEASAFSLSENEISDPVETEFGFHIIQNLGRRGNYVDTRHILVRPVITQGDLDLAQALGDSIRTLVLNDSMSFELAVRKFGFEDAQSFSNNGRMKNPATGNNFFETADISPPDVYFAIEPLEVGDISEPLELSMPNGDAVFRMYQLQSKTKPHRANLKEDYARIQQYAKESKKNVYLAEWLEKRYSDTYITVDNVYGACPNLSQWVKTEEIKP